MNAMDEDLGVCVYCSARWVAESIPIVHLSDCPETTGLYPVRACDLEPYGFSCAGCSTPFSVGDQYVQPVEGEEDTVEANCISCAAWRCIR